MKDTGIREQQIQMRTNLILNNALELFCEKGIEPVSVEAIAKKAGVGPATIYRYFETKAQLAIGCGIFYWRRISRQYVSKLHTKEYISCSGAEQMEMILGIFREIFEKEFLFLKFLQEFDIFVRKYQISPQTLKEYEEEILNLKPYVTDALQKGLSDKTLSFSYSVDEIYFTVTHTLLSLMQKLASNGRILSSDDKIQLALQVQIAGELILGGLKKA